MTIPEYLLLMIDSPEFPAMNRAYGDSLFNN